MLANFFQMMIGIRRFKWTLRRLCDRGIKLGDFNRDGSQKQKPSLWTLSLFYTLFFLAGSVCFAHQLDVKQLETAPESIGIEFAAFSSVKVYAPGEKEIFQDGMTDRNGRFYFIPDKKGKWKIEIADGLGHGKIIYVDVKEKIELIGAGMGAGGFTFWHKIIIGLSIIWGFTGLLFYLKARKR